MLTFVYRDYGMNDQLKRLSFRSSFSIKPYGRDCYLTFICYDILKTNRYVDVVITAGNYFIAVNELRAQIMYGTLEESHVGCIYDVTDGREQELDIWSLCTD